MNQDKLKQLDSLFAGEMQAERIKGASILIEHKGKTEFRNVYGSDAEDTIYKIYSMSKPITATAVMILWERGLIDLSDPVSRYLSGFKNMKVVSNKGLVDAKSEITLRQLLNMTSGLVYPGTESEADRSMEEIRLGLYEKAAAGAEMSNLDILNALGKAPLLFHPGEGFRYGISADVLAGVVEVVSGQTYGQFLRKEIFDPLMMKDTGFYVEESKINRLGKMYTRIDDAGHLAEAGRKALFDLNLYAPTKPPYIESGGGGLYSTLEDYRHFAQMLLNRGYYQEKEILSRKTIDYLSSNQLNPKQLKCLDLNGLEGYGYGNLMRVMMNPTEAGSNGSVGEFGWDGLPGTYFFIDHSEELMLVYMQQIQQGGDHSLRRKMRQIVYGAINSWKH